MIPLCIVDTNVVVGGLLSSEAGSPMRRVLDAMLAGSLHFLVSFDLLTEYCEVLLRPSIVACHELTEADVDEVLCLLALKATLSGPPPYEGLLDDVVSDPGDVHLGSLLAAAPEALVVTDDRRLAADLEGMCELATPAELAALVGSALCPRRLITLTQEPR